MMRLHYHVALKVLFLNWKDPDPPVHTRTSATLKYAFTAKKRAAIMWNYAMLLRMLKRQANHKSSNSCESLPVVLCHPIHKSDNSCHSLPVSRFRSDVVSPVVIKNKELKCILYNEALHYLFLPNSFDFQLEGKRGFGVSPQHCMAHLPVAPFPRWRMPHDQINYTVSIISLRCIH